MDPEKGTEEKEDDRRKEKGQHPVSSPAKREGSESPSKKVIIFSKNKFNLISMGFEFRL